MITRLSKILLVLSIALFSTLVAFNNVVDYSVNFAFVQHVLQMDTVFSSEQAQWRSISSPIVHHLFYALIILWEILIAALCWMGGLRLWRNIDDPRSFNDAKDIAIAGLTAGILLWLTGFVVVGAEWFLMWQSHEWNGQQGATRFVLILGMILIYLNTTDHDQRST